MPLVLQYRNVLLESVISLLVTGGIDLSSYYMVSKQCRVCSKVLRSDDHSFGVCAISLLAVLLSEVDALC